MLEGLEITEINLSGLERTLRIDSDFYGRKNLNVLKLIAKNKPKPLTDFVRVSDGNHASISNYYSREGVPYYRGGDIYNFYIEQSPSPLRIPESIYNIGTMKRSHLRKGDVLISIVGAIIGNLSLVKTDAKATCSCKLAILRPKTIQPELLAMFLQSKFGQNQVQKFRRGTGQTGLILEDFDQLLIPTYSDDISLAITKAVSDAFTLLEQSKQTYSQAENLLLEEVGLQDFEPSQEPVNIKSFKDSFGTSGRLDAEYYQKKYEQVVEKVKSKTYDTLANIVDIKKSIEPGSKHYVEDGLPFMRVADLSKNGLSTPQKFLSQSFVQANTDKIEGLKPKKGTILFSKDASVGIAYHLRQDYEGITSGAILHLTIQDKTQVIPEYLTLVLNSKVVQMQAERDAGGSIILHWRSSEIANVVVPIIDYTKQQQIADLIEQSFSLKKQSEHLLDVAKRAVEIAIEDNEQVALDYIQHEVAAYES
ncbi:MAG: restriction endonuclease subunit S [Mariprofundaceae bacterium]|nr:restriction endonuclease subunit S [Mariprofundaceae bacterium]